MFSGLIPGLNSVNSPEDELSEKIPRILIGLLDLLNQFLSSEACPATNSSLFTHYIAFFRRDWWAFGVPPECRSLVPLIFFCVCFPIVLLTLYGGDAVAEAAGESPEPEAEAAVSGSMYLCRDALFNAYEDEIVLDELCGICFEEKQNWQMFRSESCSHSFCYDCTSKYITAKIQANTIVILCPEIGCKAELDFEDCRRIIPKDVLDRWDECLCMSLIPESQKVYCPFKDCSSVLVNDTGETIGETKCPSCRRLICVRCRVPWHTEFTCDEFERLSAAVGGEEGIREDVLVEELAKKKSWRKCPNCNVYVEKTEGCWHITCRCGNEFCYLCGSKWTKSHVNCRLGQESDTS